MSYNTLLLLTGFVFSSFSCFAQSVFEKGYFIDRSGQKTECYILIEDWHSDGYLTYRKDYKEPSQSKPLAEVTEINVIDAFKIIHIKTSVDISGDTPTLFSYTQDPEWSEQDIFLRVLVEGTYTLYEYQYDGSTKFFYATSTIPIQQLIFKRYKTASGIEINDSFKLVLFQHVNCTPNMSNYFNELSYTKESLIKHFLAENKCAGSNPISYSKSNVNNLVQTLPDLNSSSTTETSQRVKESVAKEKADNTSNTIRYFGLEVNQLLQQIIDLNSNNNAATPYSIQYSSNSRKTGRGVSYGLTYRFNKFKDDPIGSARETVDRSISFRIGYERKSNWGKRWIALHGYDVTLGGSKLKTKSNQGGGPQIEIESKSSTWGFGPRVGLMFGISSKVFIGSEAMYYLQFTKGSQSITGQPSSNQKSTDFSLILPVSLFLSVKIKE